MEKNHVTAKEIRNSLMNASGYFQMRENGENSFVITIGGEVMERKGFLVQVTPCEVLQDGA